MIGQGGAQWNDSFHTMHDGLGEWKTAYPYLGIPYRVQIPFVAYSVKERIPVNTSAPYNIESVEQVVKETGEVHGMSPVGSTCCIPILFCLIIVTLFN